MKKTLTILLSLVFCFSLLTALPVCAQTQLINKVPKTIRSGSTTATAKYNSKTKTLTYQCDNQGQDISDTDILAALLSCSTDTKLNRDYGKYDLYVDSAIGLAFNDMIRSGKIKKLNLYYRLKGENFNRGYEWSFKTQNGKITTIDRIMIEGDGYTYKLSYDKAGNMKSFENIGYETTIINYSNNRITSIIDKFDGEEAKSIPQYNKKGQLIGKDDYYTSGELMESTIFSSKEKYNQDGTLAQYQYDAESPIVAYTYMTL